MTEYYGTRPKKSVFLVAMKASPNPKPISANEAFSFKLIGLAITYINSHLNHWENHFQIHIYLSTWQHIKTLNTMPPGCKKNKHKITASQAKGAYHFKFLSHGPSKYRVHTMLHGNQQVFYHVFRCPSYQFFSKHLKKNELKLIIFIFNLACSLIFILDNLFCLG